MPSPTFMPRAGRLIALLLAICLLLPPALVPSIEAQNLPGDDDPALYAPIVASQRDQIYADTAGSLSRYRIDASFAPASIDELATIEGTLELRFVNNLDAPLNELYFRLYPNSAEYGDGSLTIDDLTADDEPRTFTVSAEDTLATVQLPDELPVGEAIDLAIEFTTTIPTDPVRSYGMFSYAEQIGSYALAHWLPLLAGYDPVTGWEIGPISQLGDPVFSNTALFDVRLSAPSDLIFVTTGSEIETTTVDETTTRRYVSGPVRDFVMSASTQFLVESIVVGETTVNSYFNPDSSERGLDVLTAGVQSLGLFNDLFGMYPYQELNLVEIPLGGGAGGVEFPQIMFIGAGYYARSEITEIVPGFLEFIVVHEVAHQWWYGLVGNNHHRHAFIDEGLTNYVTTVYFGEIYGPEVGQQQVNYNLKASYFSVLFNNGDQIVDQPTDNFPSQRSYGAIVYGKAALGFGAIHDAIGDEAFFEALQAYSEEFRFAIATPDDLKAAFEEASGEDLDELWRHWFEAAEGDQVYDAEDLRQLLRELGR